MKFIGSKQLEYRKAIKDGKVVDKNKDNLITVPRGTTVSFGDMTQSVVKGKTVYSIQLTVVKDFGKGNVSKVTTLNLA
jgi:hypothetical protein|tara:strand:- start:298 stop:531 length:234 start_codon:yes stop_codon:yes gene_type:complete